MKFFVIFLLLAIIGAALAGLSSLVTNALSGDVTGSGTALLGTASGLLNTVGGVTTALDAMNDKQDHNGKKYF